MQRLFFRLALAVALVFGVSNYAMAHDPGLSATDVQLGSESTVVTITFAEADIQNLLLHARAADRPGTNDESARITELEDAGKALFTVSVDGHRLTPHEIRAELSSTGVALRFLLPEVKGSLLLIQSAVFEKVPRGHRQFISVRDAGGSLLAERILDADNTVLEIAIGRAATANHFVEFLVLGVKHILSGYDHIAFLLALLVVGPTLRGTAGIITSFTVAHSITLALATFGVARISPGVVEPMIALSVVYAGMENLVRRDLSVRWPITFAFGLIHGFGFASALQELGIGLSGISVAIPLLSFNLGVELGQIAIAVVVLPAIWALRKRVLSSERYLPVCSVMVAGAGAFWLIERLVN
jgi:hydrogenase/urease accessory protein HupE